LLALSSSLDIGPKALVFPINEAEEESHAIQFASWFDAEIR